MKSAKKYLKLAIGAAVLILVVCVMFFVRNSGSLENTTLKSWPSTSLERRLAAVRILSGDEKNAELLVKCVDKIATLPDAGEMAVRDAVSLCNTGIQIQEVM